MTTTDGILAALVLAYFAIAVFIMFYAARLPEAPRNVVWLALGSVFLGLIWPISLVAEWLHRKENE